MIIKGMMDQLSSSVFEQIISINYIKVVCNFTLNLPLKKIIKWFFMEI